eukprot:TRINITY_DN77800_c0_g1_i1.p1 TRINITY_DN77800_c0_g1~~TRINITY_DN77800_c0_g1_i1.p1  ORF type:complete len:749 (-),score=222.35 TRINITY_DN77800_c0_g1_i1:88-2334(-)
MATPTPSAEHRKGEVHELRTLLRNPKMQDAVKFKTVVEKVIAYMTLGIDVSPLFSDMIMATNTKDLVQKKMVYLYLCTYAEQNSELALLTINTLQKDCQDDDPMIRGLALRSLCSLRVAKLVEYVLLPIRRGLIDTSPYVRKIAVIGVSKLFNLDSVALKETDFIEQLYNKLSDPDPDVVINAIDSLNEILIEEGGMAINKKIIYHLLNKLTEFHEWGQCVVLDLLVKYEPASNDEVFDILNTLEPRLRHSNSAVVLAASKVFLHLTRTLPKVHADVYRRLKEPLLTMLGSPVVEISYSVISHIALLVRRGRGIFDDSYKNFYIRYNDPLAVKALKVTILGEIANASTVSEILMEISEYVTNVDVEISRQAIKTIGALAIKVEGCLHAATEHLISFLDLNMDFVTSQTCIVCKDILRKYPTQYHDILKALEKVLATCEEPEGKVAALWIIGEYGDVIDDSPYMLEPMIDAFNDEASAAVKLEILSASMKLFFKRPPEVHKMLGRLLAKVIENSEEVDVKDRALLYYRLLRYDVLEAARVVNTPKIIVDAFVDLHDVELNDRLFEEFNTLSVVFQKPSEQFINVPTGEEEEEEDEQEDQKDVAQEQDTKLLSGDDGYETEDSQSPRGPQESGPLLSATPQCDPATFQNRWISLPASGATQIRLRDWRAVQQQLEKAMRNIYFFVIASGPPDNPVKFYFYAQDQSTDEFFFAEVVLDLPSSSLTATFKGDDPTTTRLVVDRCVQLLNSLG